MTPAEALQQALPDAVEEVVDEDARRMRAAGITVVRIGDGDS